MSGVEVVDMAVHEGEAFRLVKFSDGSGGRIERWDGSAWVPGGSLRDLMDGAPATPDRLSPLGIPEVDWPADPSFGAAS